MFFIRKVFLNHVENPRKSQYSQSFFIYFILKSNICCAKINLDMVKDIVSNIDYQENGGFFMFENEYVECVLPQQKSIALIAHDNKKQDMVDWCLKNKKILEHHFLCGTGTTAKLVSDKTGLPVRGYNSGPLGGDQQIGARIVDGKIDLVIFFSDPLEAQPHDPDVKALLRIAQVYDIPIANNRSTADFIITSNYMDTEYSRKLINFRHNVDMRVKEM